MLKVGYGKRIHSLISLAFTELSNVVLVTISSQYANFSLPWRHVHDPKVLTWTERHWRLETDQPAWCISLWNRIFHSSVVSTDTVMSTVLMVPPFLFPTSRRASSWGFPVEVLPRPQWSAFLDIQEQRNTSSIVHSLWRSRSVTDCEFHKTIETESLFKKELLRR